jgi:hypothetical protein
MFRRRRPRTRRRFLRRVAFLSAAASGVYAWRNRQVARNDQPPSP